MSRISSYSSTAAPVSASPWGGGTASDVAAVSAVPAGCGVPAVSAVPGSGAAVDGTAAEETAPAAQPVKKSIDKTGNRDLFTATHRPSFL